MYSCLIALFLLIAWRPCQAASEYAGEFLSLGAGARSLALGNAYVAVVDDVTAGYWNAAALAQLPGRQLHIMHAERFAGLVKNDYIAIGLPDKGLHGLSLSLVRVGVSNIQFTTLENPDRPIGPNNRPKVLATTSSADYAIYLSGGQRLGSRLSIGTSLKIIYRDVAGYNAKGLGIDVGLRYTLEDIVIAANLRDVTTTAVSWSTNATDHIRPSLLLATAWTRSVGDGRLTVAVAARPTDSGVETANTNPFDAGVEYWQGSVALRGGLNAARRGFGFGLSPHKHLTLDIAYLDHDELEPTYRLSAGIRF